jgi:hypothetical protein
MAQTTWATSADVQDITGVSVTDQQVTIAGFIIDNYTGRPYAFEWTDSSGMLHTYAWHQKVGAADSYWLKLAVSYETVWLQAQPDAMTRMNMESVPTTRESIKLNEHGMVLGPIAKKALGRVSWLRTRSLHVRSPLEDISQLGGVNFGEVDFPWYPLGWGGSWGGYTGGDPYD